MPSGATPTWSPRCKSLQWASKNHPDICPLPSILLFHHLVHAHNGWSAASTNRPIVALFTSPHRSTAFSLAHNAVPCASMWSLVAPLPMNGTPRSSIGQKPDLQHVYRVFNKEAPTTANCTNTPRPACVFDVVVFEPSRQHALLSLPCFAPFLSF